MKKVIRNGMVAVLYSPQYGAGWFSWNTNYPQCLFSPEIVDLIETNNKQEDTDELCSKLFGPDFYAGGFRDLKIEWLKEGTRFVISESDGYETLVKEGDTQFLIA